MKSKIMKSMSRRAFLGASLVGVASGSYLAIDRFARSTSNVLDPAASGPDTLFLTWQRDPTTTMTVQWIGTDAETPDAKVSFAPVNSEQWQTKAVTVKPYAQTDFKVYRAELTGLSPGTDYQFRIGQQTPVHRFRTMPAKATDTIHFISGGDCGVNPHAIANNIQAARQDPMFAVIGGDLGYDNGASVETSLNFIRNYSKHMIGRDGRLIPLIACIGNHEVAGGYFQPRTEAPFFYAHFDGLYPERGFACLDFGDYLSLVLLDTDHTTPIAGEQTDWLEKTLANRAEHPNVLVVNHVPAYPSFRDFNSTGVDNRKYWVPLFEKYRVPAVLEHHDHTFKRTRPLLDGRAHDNGVLYLGDGSWGMLRKPHTSDELSYLAASSEDYHLSLHRIQGEERFHLALDERGRVMDACHSGQRTRGRVGVRG